MNKRLFASLALTLALLFCGCAGVDVRPAGPAEPDGAVAGTEASARQETTGGEQTEGLADVAAGKETSDSEIPIVSDTQDGLEYTFRNDRLLQSHYEKHGMEMGFSSPEEYEKAACAVIRHPDALHKLEAEDGDDVYYVEATNEFVIVSVDGYIRTYFYPNAGIDYYNRQ